MADGAIVGVDLTDEAVVDGALWRATVARRGVAVVTLFGRRLLAVAAGRLALRRQGGADAGVARLDPAGAAAAVAVDGVAIVAQLGAANLAVAADRRADGDWPLHLAQPAILDATEAVAPVGGVGVAVVTFLAVIDDTVATVQALAACEPTLKQ